MWGGAIGLVLTATLELSTRQYADGLAMPVTVGQIRFIDILTTHLTQIPPYARVHTSNDGP